MLTIGIPSRGENDRIKDMISYCINSPVVSQIIVSINPPNETANELQSLFRHEKKVEIIVQEKDLGLYGNFRFLVNRATSKYFQWFCLDDLPSPEWDQILNQMQANQLALAIPVWKWQEWDPTEKKFFGDKILGPNPKVDTYIERLTSGLRSQPSWIFGVWNREILLHIWPKLNFDWLDVFY
jgi:hypothetical protein